MVMRVEDEERLQGWYQQQHPRALVCSKQAQTHPTIGSKQGQNRVKRESKEVTKRSNYPILLLKQPLTVLMRNALASLCAII
jgi:hypothetical protein